MTTSQMIDGPLDYQGSLVSHSKTPAARRYPGHIGALDGLRGLAILLVLTYHFTLGMRGRGLPALILFKATSAGWCGVDLFFVLSGFLITGILCETRESPVRFRNFYARRALRVFPLYYGTLIAVLAARPTIARWTGGLEGLDGAFVWLWSYSANILVALRGRWFPLSHFWSLAVEEHYYLVWPAVIYWCDRKAACRLCIGMIVLAGTVRACLVSHGAALAAYCLTVCRMDALALGSLLALASRGSQCPGGLVPHAKRANLASSTGLFALCLCRFGLGLHDAAVQTIGYILLDIFFASLLILVVEAPAGSPLAVVFNLAPLRSLGRYSYGLYVYNSLFLLVAEGSSLLPRLVDWSGSSALGRMLYIAAAALSTMLMAWLSWHLFEIHFLKLKRHFPTSRRTEPGGGRHEAPSAQRALCG